MLSTRGSETGKTLSSLQGALYDRNGESSAMGMCTRQAPPGWRGCSLRTSRVVREGRGGMHPHAEGAAGTKTGREAEAARGIRICPALVREGRAHWLVAPDRLRRWCKPHPKVFWQQWDLLIKKGVTCHGCTDRCAGRSQTEIREAGQEAIAEMQV